MKRQIQCPKNEFSYAKLKKGVTESLLGIEC